MACRSPQYHAADGGQMPPRPQLLTPVSSIHTEATIRFVSLSSTRNMPPSVIPSNPRLNRLTVLIVAQDGSETEQELLPKLSGRLAVGQASPPTPDAVSAIIKAVQVGVKRSTRKRGIRRRRRRITISCRRD